MYDTDYKTSNLSIIKPFQRIFFKNNSPNSQATTSTFLFKHNYTLANRISFVQKKRPSDFIVITIASVIDSNY